MSSPIFITSSLKRGPLMCGITMSVSRRCKPRELEVEMEPDHERALDILVAEDNTINQNVALRLLGKHGHRVAIAGNGIEAIALWEKQRFDLVLMDVQMPEMGGFEATVEIRTREIETGQRIPIIAMTAHAMKGDRERCLLAGMDDYLTKPIQARLLCEVISRLKGRHQEEKSASVFSAVNAGTKELEALVDPGTALERLGGDQQLL